MAVPLVSNEVLASDIEATTATLTVSRGRKADGVMLSTRTTKKAVLSLFSVIALSPPACNFTASFMMSAANVKVAGLPSLVLP